MQFPAFGDGDGKEESHACHFGDCSKGFVVVEALNLVITVYDESGFIMLNSPVSIIFDTVDPFATNGLLTWGKVFSRPCVVIFQGCNFFCHCLAPIRILNCFMEKFGLKHPC